MILNEQEEKSIFEFVWVYSPINYFSFSCKKVAPRFELGIEALQAPALPLGHATTWGAIVQDNPKKKQFLLESDPLVWE